MRGCDHIGVEMIPEGETSEMEEIIIHQSGPITIDLNDDIEPLMYA